MSVIRITVETTLSAKGHSHEILEEFQTSQQTQQVESYSHRVVDQERTDEIMAIGTT